MCLPKIVQVGPYEKHWNVQRRISIKILHSRQSKWLFSLGVKNSYIIICIIVCLGKIKVKITQLNGRLERGNEKELTAFALYHLHNEHQTTGKGYNHLDSNLPEHEKDQKLFFPEIPTRTIL